MERVKLSEIVDVVHEVLENYIEEAGKKRKVVVRGGKRQVKYTTRNPRQKMVNGKVKPMSAAERIKRSRSAKKAAKKRRGKASVMNRKRAKSMRKRSSMGM